MARFSTLGVALLLLVLAGCNRPSLDPARAAVLPVDLDNARYLATQCGRVPLAVSGAWLPNSDHIKRLDETLAGVLRDKLQDAPRMALTLVPTDYYRQYAGVFVETESQKRFIYINGFHESYVQMTSDKTEWILRPVVVCGGGSWYFGALYDVDNGEISQFEFNRP